MGRVSVCAVLMLLACGCSQQRDFEMTSPDERIDFILDHDMNRTARCLNIVSLRDAGARSSGFSPARFQEAEIRRLAAQIVQGKGKEIRVAVKNAQVNPARKDFQCNAAITRPVEIGGVSFVEFTAPDGRVGAYAFRKGANGWKPVERVKLGYW